MGKFDNILGEGRTPSEAQQDIIKFVERGIGNAVVISRAGSGKSTTIELAVASVPENKKILVVAYNKHIADHLKHLFTKIGLSKVDVYTYHSLGYSILKFKYKNEYALELDEDKYRKYVNANISDLSHGLFDFMSGVDKLCYKKNIEELIEKARVNKAQSIKEIDKVAKKYNIITVSNECEATREALKWGEKHLSEIDYTDMVWLPYELGLNANMPPFQYDMIFIDEAQDSSLIQQNLLELCKKRNTRFLAFGDPQQTINAWCGSDAQAFKHFSSIPNTKKYKLGVSFRCSKAVAEKVRTVLPDFEVPETSEVGAVNQLMPLDSINNGDLVLCRMTAPLITLYMKLIKQGKAAKVIGLNLSDSLIDVIKDTFEPTVEGVITVLYKRLFQQWEKLKEMYECSLRDVVTESQIIQLYDEIQSIESLADGATDINDVINRIQEIFPKKTNDDADVVNNSVINLSTIHRAKGLESDNVFIACPSIMPSPLAKEGWETEAEKNLIYVAWTRARKTLNFIDEKQCRPPKSFSGSEDLYRELLEKKKIYGEDKK